MERELASMLSAGFAAFDRGELAAAEQCFRRVLGAQPSHHGAWNALAWTCLRAGNPLLALEHAQRAHALSRRNEAYLNTLGVAYGECGVLDEAEASLRKALKLKPAYVEALVNLGKVKERNEELGEAGRLYSRALAMAPGFPKLASSLVTVHLRCAETAKARALLETSRGAIEGPDLAMLGAQCDLEQGDTQQAVDRLSSALRQHPEWSLVRTSLAHTLLSLGRWRDGWREYLQRPNLGERTAPAALPANLQGRRILLEGEQGIGDVLFFLRFAPFLRTRGAALALRCEDKLRPLFDAEFLRTAGEFDGQFPVGDLPALIECAETPAAFPLRVSEEERRQARQRLAGLGPAPYLGVTWRAGTDTARAREFGEERKSLAKSLPPRLLGAAVRGWRGTLIVLQRGARPEDTAEFAAGLQGPAHDLSALGDDLRALLGVLAVLDDYAGVSNANMHLLAGLGRPARVLVPRPAEWRWMHEGPVSPWFPGFPLYRQPPSRDWAEPLARLKEDLAHGDPAR